MHIDAHHTVEDCGWALGDAFSRALGDRRGINRYGMSFLPMDEALTRVAIDISGRPYLVWHVKLPSPRLGDMDTEVFEEFFRAFSQASGMTLHIETCYGSNTHHIIESSFKALAQACKIAVAIDPRQSDRIPSTKGCCKKQSSMKLVIVDYGSGNLRSVEHALKTAAHDAGLPHQTLVSSDPDVVASADYLVLPGVGAFADCKKI